MRKDKDSMKKKKAAPKTRKGKGKSMKTGKARIVILVDRSGSMSNVREATVSGINEFITAQKAEPGEATIKIVQFDEHRGESTFETILDAPLNNITTISDDQYTPRGMTPLNDSTARAINELGAELRSLPEADRPDKVIVCIVTDGHENASKEFANHKGGKAKIKAMVEHQQSKYNWKFTYVGANVDAITEAAQYGIMAMDALQFTSDVEHTKNAFRGVSNYMKSVRSSSAENLRSVSYSANDRLESVDENDPQAKNANVPAGKTNA